MRLFAMLCSATVALGLSGWTSAELAHARDLLSEYPLIDTHIDLPLTMRTINRYPMHAIDQLNSSFPGQFDLPRARQGQLGGAFWTANAPCPAAVGRNPGPDFLNPTETVQHALESLDLIHAALRRWPELIQHAVTSSDVHSIFKKGNLATLIGLEGTHALGNSLSTLRMFHKLGVRYVTLTHVCHSSFASSNGGGAGTTGSSIPPVHPGNGLTSLGRSLVKEMNRLGMIVDLSHTSDQTAAQAIDVSQAPVIWSHSGARSIHNHPRNVPDDVLSKIGSGPGKNNGVVLSVLYPIFVDPTNATVARVADHVEHIASVCGRAHVGLGSDFNGISASVEGWMTPASGQTWSIAEFIRRGWSDTEIGGLMGGNLLRVMDEVDEVAKRAEHTPPSPEIYEKRTDLPAHAWGGPNYAYLPQDVKAIVHSQRLRDEL